MRVTGSFIWILLLLSLFGVGLSGADRAVAAPAIPGEHDYLQPDGSRFSARLLGDEWNLRVETAAGYTVARDDHGWWRYVGRYSGRDPVLHERAAHLPPPDNLQPGVAPVDKYLLRSQRAADRQSRSSWKAPASGNFNGNVLYLLVQFSDVVASTSADSWGDFIRNNIRDYYLAASYGKAVLDPASETSGTPGDGVVGWMTLPYPHPDPGQPNTMLAITDMHTLVRDAIVAADDAVDFAQYDTDGSGDISSQELAVVVITAGGEGAVYDDPPNVWAHVWSVVGVDAPVVDGVTVGAGGYAAFGELHRGQQATMGIMVHELGHLIFELPDLYDTDGTSSGIGAFGLMSSGSWGAASGDSRPGETPVMPSAWVRHRLGWASAAELALSDSITASGDPQASADNSLRIMRSGRSGEYFLIENREPAGYDRGLQKWLGEDFGGLAIWHIDDNQVHNRYDEHRMVDLEAADGTPLGRSRGRSSDLWFAANASQFDVASNPASHRYDGADSGAGVTGISAPGTQMALAAEVAPQAEGDFFSIDEDQPTVSVDVLANDSDDNGDDLAVVDFESATLSGGQVEYLGEGRFHYTPPQNHSGFDAFPYTVSDRPAGEGGRSVQAWVDIKIEPVNDPPLVQADSAQGTEDAEAIDIAPLVNDSDIEGDQLEIAGFDPASAAGGSVEQIAPGLLRYVPPADFSGDDSFSYSASDGSASSVPAQVNISVAAVNDPPQAIADQARTDEDSTIELQPLDNDDDIDGDPLQIASFDVASAAGGQLESLGDGRLRYTPPQDFSGDDSFGYSASDGSVNSAPAQVSVRVAAVNDAPQAVDDQAQTDEDGAVELQPLDNDLDVDLGEAALQIASFDSSSTAGGQIESLGDGRLRYTPPADFFGDDSFAYSAGDGIDSSAPAQVQIRVIAVDDPPQARDDEAATDEDSAVELWPLDNDIEIDGDPLQLESFDAASAAGGLIEALDGGGLRYTPPQDFSGDDSFSYAASDGHSSSAPAQVRIRVSAVNDPPQATDDQLQTDEDTAVELLPLANDVDIDGDLLQIESFDTSSAAGGRIEAAGDSGLRYTPPQDFSGDDSFGYAAGDGSASQRALVSISVAAVNDPPRALDDSAETDQERAVSIDVLGNDDDVDGTQPLLAGFDARSASGGSIERLDDDRLRYTPPVGFAGEDSFTYRLRDAATAELEDAASVHVLVGIAGQLATPLIEPGDQASHTAIEVVVRSPDAAGGIDADAGVDGPTLHYTLDGSEPRRDHGAVIASGASLRIEHSATLRVLAWRRGWRDSPLASAEYLIDAQLDSDGDGMSDAWEIAAGFDPDDPADAELDSDGDGESNVAEFLAGSDPQVDDQPPELIAPTDLQVDASGWWTPLALGEALALDARDGQVAVSAESATGVAGPWRPGSHLITWRASDTAGNQVSAEQRLVLRPLAELEAAASAVEGGEALFVVQLNGDAPEYPVALDYAIGGSADADDHDARDGRLLIESGRRAELRIAVRDDGPGEADETLSLTLIAADGAALGASSQRTLALVEDNLAPRLQLRALQGGVALAAAGRSGGPLTLDAGASDPNPEDQLFFDWSTSDGALLAQARTEGGQLLLDDPGLLDAGWYRVALRVADTAGAAASDTLWLRLGDGEPLPDADGDGVGDVPASPGFDSAASDPLNAAHLLQLDGDPLPPVAHLAALPGLRLGLGEVARLAGNSGARISLSQLDAHLAGRAARWSTRLAGSADDPGFEHGDALFSLRLSGLDQPGASAALVLPLAEGWGENSALRAFAVGGWSALAAQRISGQLASATGCPPPDDSGYLAALDAATADSETAASSSPAPADNCLRIELVDGGAADADGVANGTLELLLGVAQRIEATSIFDDGGEAMPDDYIATPIGGGQVTANVDGGDLIADGDGVPVEDSLPPAADAGGGPVAGAAGGGGGSGAPLALLLALWAVLRGARRRVLRR